MDSLTQIVLGASVGEATLGKKIGNKALLWGAIAGTIPDLDVFIGHYVDSVTKNEIHRGFSHSILFCVLFGIAKIIFFAYLEKLNLSIIISIIVFPFIFFKTLFFNLVEPSLAWMTILVFIIFK